MPIQDKVVTVKGIPTRLVKVELWPQLNGSVTLGAIGDTVDANGAKVALDEAKINVTGVGAVDNLVARGLTELRKANGLE